MNRENSRRIKERKKQYSKNEEIKKQNRGNEEIVKDKTKTCKVIRQFKFYFQRFQYFQ